MQNEATTRPRERFLQAVLHIPDPTLKTWKEDTIRFFKDRDKPEGYLPYMQWQRQENEVAVFTTYAYADLDLPQSFDCLFNYGDPLDRVYTGYTITQAILEGRYPTGFIGRGHKHLCILRFEEGIPELIRQLSPDSHAFQWDPYKVIGLCRAADLPAIIAHKFEEERLGARYGNDRPELGDGV